MEGFKFLNDFGRLAPFLAIVIMIFSIQVSGQINTACSAAMLRSFNPCINFMSSGGSGSPTSACCQSLKELTSSGKDCLCLIVTGNVPFKVPNRNWAITLPKACNNGGVPIECKGSATPLPAPGPAALVPSGSPRSFRNPRSPPAPSPEGDDVPEPFNPPLGPVGETTPDLTPPSPPNGFGTPNTGLTPPSPSGGSLGNPYNGFTPPSTTDGGFGNPDTSSGFKPDLTPSYSPHSQRLSVFVLLAACGAIALKLY
ncbi:non-specific lipid transfer protein GPI-anchored 21-like isoform X1 [Nicotiana tomentosiformis]|uniref:non-specific lipid transfer protein GPI-anchored 21-like isoform X1 n=1 Tax=Nicotiana tomentosiformis TaxID=4098 RepID=UPI00051C8409|nr:leucine-rich repeat extensin-like protein 5 isoform X1 [Nicotiana tomentosiformis]XP_018633088.1 leucine-rich repeat extensin-like protein 5 isoform X1 [Nicotiana tomentosiformis]